MELHLANLYKLCRVCGGKVVTKRGNVNAKTCSDYVDLLRTCFGILPSEDKDISAVVESISASVSFCTEWVHFIMSAS